jgi:D-alanyl-D-alanine carboxypeptidase (penicillin-binding protein 5/6)
MKSFLIALFATVCFSVAAQTPQAPEVAARAYPVEQASLTKLMTAYLVFDALRTKKIDLKQALPVSERAWKMPGSRMFIDPKMKVPVEDLIKGMIVQSGNDATVAAGRGRGRHGRALCRS